MADAAKILLTEGVAPGTPASGQTALYVKTDHLFYRKDSAGNEVVVTPGLAASISDGDVTHAPDGNSVFDALALKAPLSGAALTSATINALTPTALATGFTVTGGTTSKTLTVPLDASVSGTNTGDNAANSSSHYIGTTSVALNRASAALTLAGITLTTPDIGTPSGGTLTNCTGLPLSGLLPLTGYTSGAGTVAAADTVLQAIQKLNGNFEAGSYAYGVKWDTSQSSPILTKGIVVNGVFIPTNYTSYPIQSQMKRCVKSPLGAKVYNLSSTNSIYKENLTTPLRSGTATSTSAGKLVDTEADFTTAGVAIGHWVHNTTTNIATQVTAVDSATILSVKLDRFVSGNAYSIGTANPQADGAVMVEVPACQYIMCTDGVYKYFLISEGSFNFKKSDSTIVTSDYHPWFAEGGMFRPYQYWGAFESVWWDATATATYKNHDGTTVYDTGDKAVSVPGFQPLTGQSRIDFRILHSNYGSSYHTESYYAYDFMCLLFITEYGTLNSQIALPGYTEGTLAYANTRTTGRTMHLGNVSGTIAGVSGFDPGTYNVANSYRGIENCYGHIWKWLDGINFYNQLIYINNNPATWVEDTATNYINTGLSLPASGYQKDFHSGLMLPSTVGADSATYVTDYVWSAAGWLALFSGGSLADGAYAGVFSRHADCTGSLRSANFGSRSAAV